MRRSGKPALLQVWVEPGNENKTDHAMRSLERAIRWDEERYGLELDLDRFMIVAVGDFNMGAMENKGLNLFNTKYVLASPATATDIAKADAAIDRAPGAAGTCSPAAALKPVLELENPAVVYLPHEADGHPDHQATLRILRAALRRCRELKPELLAYEVWTPLPEHDLTVDISRVMPRKLRALRAHRSQLGEFDYVRAVTGLNQFRGALAGKCRFAEVFQTLSPER